MTRCTQCQSIGFSFDRPYSPGEFLEGKRDALIWIVGLNPAAEPSWADGRDVQGLEACFDRGSTIPDYFRKFQAVSPLLFELLGVPRGAAHTDIVKCSSRAFPPPGVTDKQIAKVVQQCSTAYLAGQLRTHRPRLIIGNGARVASFLLTFLPPNPGTPANSTSYWSSLDGANVCVVLSGFIGRLDTYSRRRLGQEVEHRLKEVLHQAGGLPSEWRVLSSESLARLQDLMQDRP